MTNRSDGRWAELATRLGAARLSARPMTGLKPADLPTDEPAAYAVQDALIRAAGARPQAWKVGATSSAAQAGMGLTQPFAGPVFSGHIQHVAGTLAATALIAPKFEPEIAVILKDDLVPSGRPVTAADARGAIGSVHPAIEVVDCRFEDGLRLGGLALIADCGINAALLLGPAGSEALPDYDSVALDVRVDGSTISGRVAPPPETEPSLMLAWLANHLHGRGLGLRAGDIVTTGSQAGMIPLPGAGLVEVDFGTLGRVSLRIE